MAISRMQQPRQMYGLGSLVKSVTKGVKSAVSGVKDFVKSDAGKALGIAALGFGIPGTSFGGLFGRASFMVPGGKAVPGLFGFEGIGPALQAAQTKLGLDVADPEKGPTFSQFGKVFALGSLGGAALEALTASGADEEELENIRDVESLKGYLRRGYKQLNPSAEPEQIEQFVTANTREYAANGGRIGYQDGTPKEGIETLTPMKKPGSDVQYVRDMIKSLDGFAQLIAQEGNLDRQTFQGHMDLFEDFRQRNDIDAMPAYTYLQRRVQELNPEVAKMIYITQEDRPNKAYGGRMGFENGTYFDEQTTNIRGKKTTGPMPGGKTPQIPEEEFLKYQQFKENKIVPVSSDSKPEYGTKEYFKQNLDNLNLEQFIEKPFLLNPFSIGLIEDRLNSFEKAGGDSSKYRNLYEKIKQENTKYFQSLSEAEQKAYIDRHRKSLEKDIGLGILPGQEELGILDLKKEKGIPQPKKDPFDIEGFKQYRRDAARGGRMGYALGDRAEDNAMQASGIMNLPLNQNPAGVTELDLRETGGFIPPVGVKEKADDIPAMLSNNEFVFTADAVRGMGDGDVNKGAQRMYDMMKKLENGGRV